MKYINVIIFLITIFSFSLAWTDVIWFEDFESASQWTLTGEFEINSPHGYGGDYGNPDPDAAYEGAHCLGTDLTGLGSQQGDYEANVGNHAYKAISPTINCSQYLNVTISFQKWLNIEQPDYDKAYFEISIDGGASWIEIWANDATIEDNGWSEMSFDVAEFANQQSSLKLRYAVGPTDASWFYSGWNVDNITVTGEPAIFGTLSGYIYDVNDSSPLEGAEIIVNNYNTQTNEEGYYSFLLPLGNHDVAFRNLDYFETIINGVNIINETETLQSVFLTPCSIPANLNAEIVDNSNVQLQWDEPENQLQSVVGYNIYRNDVLIQSVIENNFLDIALFNGTYIYYVTAIYIYGNSLPSNEVEIEITEYTAIDLDQIILSDEAIFCYPNPVNLSSNSGVNIAYNVKENSQLKIDIYNIKGQCIRHLYNGTNSIGNHSVYWDGRDDCGKLVAEGVYFSRLDSHDQQWTSKIIVLR